MRAGLSARLYRKDRIDAAGRWKAQNHLLLTRDGQGEFKGGINELHQRFREQEVALFEKHGAEIVAVWQSLDNPSMLIWMLAYRDRAHREEVWAGFGADPEWDALRRKYMVPLERPNVFMMSAADYSPLK